LPVRPTQSFRTLVLLRLCAAVVALVGLLVLVGWATNNEILKRGLPSAVTMKPNSAACFVFCGCNLWLAGARSRWARRVARAFALVTALIGLLTLAEYFSGFRLGLDEWLFQDSSQPIGDSLPARMSPATAFCFLIAGCALFMAALPQRQRSLDPYLGATGASLAAVGFIGIAGYLIDGLFHLRWWNYTGLAVPTAVAFCFLGLGVLGLIWREGQMAWALDKLTTWGFLAGVLMLLVSAAISYHFTSAFGDALGRVSHTQEVLKEVERVETTILELQAAQRAYILTGAPALREQFDEAKRSLPSRLDRVYLLTGDNPQQQRNVAEIRPAIEAQVKWAEATMDTYDHDGAAAAAALIAKGTGVPLGRVVRIRMGQLRTEEYSLLGSRQDDTSLASKNTFLVLPLGTIVSMVLLTLGIFFLNAGARERVVYQRDLENSYREIRAMKDVLEERVIARTAELETANRELEAFTYTVSHDLRAPLRAVDGYSQAVIEDYAKSLPDEGGRLLRVIRSSAQHMGQLIDDLLMFSRLGRQALERTETDTVKLVNAALQDVEPQIKGRNLEVRIGNLPKMSCDPALMRQVWVNLLSNAAKYSAKREHAVIEVDFKEMGVEGVYLVRDNGSGFDMRYVNKLFGVFQRLHRSDEFEGTGVGLAIVQRVVTRHGGRIWAEGAVDQGATFFFTVPRPPVASADLPATPQPPLTT
jgi:signal transduction histidine kinase